MRNFIVVILFLLNGNLHAQKITSDNIQVTDAYNLAVNTIEINVRRGILAAGGEYGGEWTRDIAINTWNGVSMMNPEVAEQSLWSVTLNRDTIGHQYWDRIIWVIAAWNHYLVTGDMDFLKQAYTCSVNSMEPQEKLYFDSNYGLFKGPSVFNDGIAGYEEPVFEYGNPSSNVLDYETTYEIKCLSTNCIYYGAYLSLAEMAKVLNMESSLINGYSQKAAKLKLKIVKHFYDESQNTLNYLIDHKGNVDKSQEALGLSYAVIFGVLTPGQAYRLIENAHVSPFGITSVYPDFQRFSPEIPGRHNNIIWPMVNGFFARAAIDAGNKKAFNKEFRGLTQLALDEDKGNYQFWEMFNPYTGKPDGGWQTEIHWSSCRLQTWSATAYINMVHYGLLGLRIENNGLSFSPYVPDNISVLHLDGIKYHGAILNITVKGKGSKIKSFSLNGKKQPQAKINPSLNGKNQIVIEME